MAVAEFETRAYGDGDDSEVNKLLLRGGSCASRARTFRRKRSARLVPTWQRSWPGVLKSCAGSNPHWPIRTPTTARPCRRRFWRAGKRRQRALSFTASASTRQAGSGKCTWPTIPS